MSSTFRPEDLKSSIVDTRWKNEKWTWSEGSLRHVIKALGGMKVAVELDNHTGWTLVGATLSDSYDGRLSVHTEEAKDYRNPTGLTRYFMPKVGVIIGLEQCSKYDAIGFERTEHELARKLFLADHADLPEGSLEIRSTARGVIVSHKPNSYREGRYQYREYSLAQLQEASPCEHCMTLTPEYENLHEKTCPVYIANAEARKAK